MVCRGWAVGRVAGLGHRLVRLHERSCWFVMGASGLARAAWPQRGGLAGGQVGSATVRRTAALSPSSSRSAPRTASFTAMTYPPSLGAAEVSHWVAPIWARTGVLDALSGAPADTRVLSDHRTYMDQPGTPTGRLRTLGSWGKTMSMARLSRSDADSLPMVAGVASTRVADSARRDIRRTAGAGFA
jgi:hypothetical protein